MRSARVRRKAARFVSGMLPQTDHKCLRGLVEGGSSAPKQPSERTQCLVLGPTLAKSDTQTGTRRIRTDFAQRTVKTGTKAHGCDPWHTNSWVGC